MNNRDLLMFAQFFSQGVDKSVHAYEKAQANAIAAERNRIAAQDKKDNMAYRQELLRLKKFEASSLDAYRTGSLDVKRAAAAAKAAGAGGTGLSQASQDYLNQHGVVYNPPTTPQVNVNVQGGDGPDPGMATSSDMPSSVGGEADNYARGGMVRNFAGGGMAGGIDGTMPLGMYAGAGGHSPLAAGANMFTASFKMPRIGGGIDETGATRGQTRLQRWIDGPPKQKDMSSSVKELDTGGGGAGAIDFTQTYANGGVVLPVDAGTSGPVSGRGYRAAPPITR